jgi:hypothetical protein
MKRAKQKILQEIERSYYRLVEIEKWTVDLGCARSACPHGPVAVARS